MGTIVARKRANGSTAYMGKIILKQDGKIVHRETQTFDRKSAANAWIGKREEELKAPGGLASAATAGKTVGDAIDMYLSTSRKQIGRTKAQVLDAIREDEIAAKPAAAIRSADLVEWAQRLGKTRQPQTVGNYVSHLSAVFAIAQPAWNIALDYGEMKNAQVVMKRLGVIKSSNKNEQRPTRDELDRILATYKDRETRQPSMAPMIHIVVFALFSTRRQSEITRILWDDLDEENSRVLVRDMKNPGEKVGNDVWCDLPPEALAVALAMPRVRPEIFPYNGESISASFTRVCSLLGIHGIDFHRLRHEGVSRLFEMGWTIPQVSAVSGHRSWSSLKRYAHIKKAGDKFTGWQWLEVAKEPARAGSRPISKRSRAALGIAD